MHCLKNSSSNIKILVLFLLILNLVKSNTLCFQEDNPPEDLRSYSSVFTNDPIGTGHARSMLNSLQGWTAQIGKDGEWLEINLKNVKTISGIIIQKRLNENQYVITYKVSYSLDNIDFKNIEKTFNGVITNPITENQKFYDYVPIYIRAQHIRVYPQTYNSKISMRIGILINSEEYIKTNCIPLQNDVFYDEVNKIIKPCSADSTIKCGVCTSDSLPNYEKTRCILKSTSENYILVNNYFHSCDVSCETCVVNTNQCLTCKSNYFFMEDQPSICKNTQSDGYYFNTSIQK